MAQIIKLKRGTKAQVPASGMTANEPLYCTDTSELYVSTSATTKQTVVPDIASLAAITIADSDLFILQDVSETTGMLAKKATFAEVKTALNIPAGASDEKVASVSGATAGYLNDVLQVGSSLSKTQGTNILTIDITTIDGGTFV